jgi:nitrogen regulatory protein P-II 1
VKRIEAIIRPLEVNGVKDRLLQTGARGMTISDIREITPIRHRHDGHHEPTGSMDIVPRVRVQVVAPDDMVDPIVQAIVLGARAGKAGDGRIIVSPVTEVVRIRTGERGAEAV